MSVKHTYRDFDGNMITKTLTPVKAIRAFCLECLGNSPMEVAKCSHKVCPVYPFRFGKDPGRKMDLSDEQRQKLSERAKKFLIPKN